ncbi:MAG TPA: hypothetical protein VI306_10285 [Pyrinomonadaceae bacterium]
MSGQLENLETAGIVDSTDVEQRSKFVSFQTSSWDLLITRAICPWITNPAVQAKNTPLFCAVNGTPSDWGKFLKNAILRVMAAYIVSFVAVDGICNSVEIGAEGLYEAGVIGFCAFHKHNLEPAGLTKLEVEIRSSGTHILTVSKISEWLQRGVRSQKRRYLNKGCE